MTLECLQQTLALAQHGLLVVSADGSVKTLPCPCLAIVGSLHALRSITSSAAAGCEYPL